MASTFASAIYQNIIRRNSVFLTTIFASAFAFEMFVFPPQKIRAHEVVPVGTARIWDSMNRGRQWKDVKHLYMNKAEGEDEE